MDYISYEHSSSPNLFTISIINRRVRRVIYQTSFSNGILLLRINHNKFVLIAEDDTSKRNSIILFFQFTLLR